MDKKAETTLLVFLLVFVSAATGVIVGNSAAYRAIQADAVRSEVGEYVADAWGRVAFRWKMTTNCTDN